MAAKVRIQITWADGRSVERLFESSTIVIGSGPQAEFQVTQVPEVAEAHLLVMPRADGCWVATAREAKVPPMYAGKAFDNGMLPWGAEIDIGSITVRILKPGATSRTSVTRLALMGCVAAYAAYSLLATDSKALPQAEAPPPPLFDPLSGDCPEAGRALPRATEALAEADARESRYLWDRAEGIAAVGQLRIAELCAQRAGNKKVVNAAHVQRMTMEQRLESDFRALRISLERAIKRDDLKTIAASTYQLRRLLGHRPGPYLYWLSELQRKAQEKLSETE